jgi:hypothetical protein
MPNDWFRAAQDFFRNMMNSRLAHLVTKTGIVSLAETHGSPELAIFVRRNFDPLWDWIVRNLLNGLPVYCRAWVTLGAPALRCSAHTIAER